ncbi:hypothetical protein GCM10011591_42420 [Nocardia camponoti]|uniref:Lon N-terminal domain-containing protein n=2 Tax=Nocardia camponoti TaxID=1616106 RepID=A0A917VDI2_9NOCA|nr:hypothetical protein GCM10011591_42420 [Nocardia camponoti]
MFPLGAVLLPGESLSLNVFEPRYVALLERCLDGESEPEFGVVLIARGREVGGGDVRTDVGTIAGLTNVVELPGKRFRVRATGTERIRINTWLPDDPYPIADVMLWPDEPGLDDTTLLADLTTRVDELRNLTITAAKKAGIRRPTLPSALTKLPTDPTERSYEICARLPIGATDRQAALAAPDPTTRLAALITAVDDAIAILRFRLQ